MDELLEFILKIEKRPQLLIGNTELKSLGHYFDGYIFAKSESNKDFGRWLYVDFREFLANKYNESRTLNWYGLIIANEVGGDSTDAFFRLLHEYLANHG